MSTTSVQRNDADVPRVGGERGQNEPGAKTPATGGTITAEPARTPAVEAPPPSTTLPEKDPSRYRLIGEHGRGGIGRVLTAFDEELERSVAVKELHHVNQASEARFIREAKITARLEHPSIVPVHEAGRWPDGTPFYAMKLIAGRSLKQLIEQADTFEDRLKLLPSVLAVAEAIAYAHSEGVIHRDLKPSNVIVGDYGETVVIDWGLAKDLRATDDDAPHAGPYRTREEGAELTQAGEILGTPAYMPPEQARGEEVDERADVYSLGAMLYHVLAGRAPFDGATSEEVLRKALGTTPRPLRERTPHALAELSAIVDRAMQRSPNSRYPSAGEFADDLRRYQNGQLVKAHHYTVLGIVRRWIGRHRAIVATLAVATVAVAVFTVVSVTRIVAARDRARSALDRAERERESARRSRDRLLLQHAGSFIDKDPTRTLALLSEYLRSGDDIDEARRIAASAVQRGVAKQVMSVDDQPIWHITFSDDGHNLAFGGGTNGLGIWRAASEKLAFIPFDGEFSFSSSFVSGQTPPSVIAGGDGTLRVVQIADQRIIEFDRHSPMTIPGFSGDGSRVVAQSGDRRISVWSVNGDSRIDFASSYELGDVFTARFLSDDLIAVTSNTQPTAEVHSLASGRSLLIEGHSGRVLDIAYAPEAALVATASSDTTIRLWRIEPLTHIATLQGHTGPVMDLDLSRDGALLVSGAEDRTIRLWNTPSAQEVAAKQLPATVSLVELLDRTRTAVATDYDGGVWMWDIDADRMHTLRGHAGEVSALAISPDESQIATGDYRGEVRVWRGFPTRSAKVLASLPSTVNTIAYIDERNTIAAATSNGELGAWHGNGTVTYAPRNDGGEILRLYPAGDGRAVLIWRERALQLWTPDEEVTRLGATHNVERWVVVPDRNPGTFLAAERDDGGRVWRVNAQNRSWDYLGASGSSIINLRPLSRAVVTVSDDNVVSIIAGEHTVSRESFTGRILSLATSEKGDEWVAGSDTGEIRVCRSDNSECTTKQVDFAIRKVEPSPTGVFFIADNSGAVYKLDPANDSLTLLAKSDNMVSLLVESDGWLFAAGPGSGTLLATELATGLTVSLSGHTAGIRALIASDHGMIYSASLDRTVVAWDPSHLDVPPRDRSLFESWISQHSAGYLPQGEITP